MLMTTTAPAEEEEGTETTTMTTYETNVGRIFYQNCGLIRLEPQMIGPFINEKSSPNLSPNPFSTGEARRKKWNTLCRAALSLLPALPVGIGFDVHTMVCPWTFLCRLNGPLTIPVAKFPDLSIQSYKSNYVQRLCLIKGKLYIHNDLLIATQLDWFNITYGLFTLSRPNNRPSKLSLDGHNLGNGS